MYVSSEPALAKALYSTLTCSLDQLVNQLLLPWMRDTYLPHRSSYLTARAALHLPTCSPYGFCAYKQRQLDLALLPHAHRVADTIQYQASA